MLDFFIHPPGSSAINFYESKLHVIRVLLKDEEHYKQRYQLSLLPPITTQELRHPALVRIQS